MDLKKTLKPLIKYEHAHKRVLELLFVIFIVFNIEIPMKLAKLVDTPIGNAVVAVIALTMFAAGGPVAGILALIAAHTLIKRSSEATGTIYLQGAEKAEEIKKEILNKYNSFPKTLEEEVVGQMAPLVAGGNPKSNVKPVLNKIDGAAPLDYEGVM